MDERFLNPANQKVAGEFINGQLWSDFKRCLMARRPDAGDVKDDIHIAAAKGHQRAGFEMALRELEKLPFEHDTTQTSPFHRPAVLHTAD